MIRKSKKDGFTLIELLVVISIISLLSSAVLASLNEARVKARDAALLADTKTLITALELYYDNNGRYPSANSDGFNEGRFVYMGRAIPWFTSIKGSATDTLLKNALQPYLPQLPTPGIKPIPFDTRHLMSRMSYMLVHKSQNSIYTNLSEIDCGPDGTETGKCYVITIVTERDTQLGPAETVIRLINGTAKWTPPSSNQNIFTWWGFGFW